MNPTLKLAVLKTIKEAIQDRQFEKDIERVQSDLNDEWYSGQTHQSWKLVPARDLIVVWNTYAKYGRIDEKKLERIWSIVKDCVLKILINTDVTNGSDPDFFDKEEYDEITAEDWKRWSMFISDRSNSPVGRGSIDWSGPGMGRYSDASHHLFKLLEKGYNASTDEELLIAVDQILNFVHGSGAMAKWFVEGGEMTLSKLRDMDVKGIVIPGKLFEKFHASFENHLIRAGEKVYVEIFKNPTERELKECTSRMQFGLILNDMDAYVWNRDKAYHTQVMHELKLGKGCLPLLAGKDATGYSLYITDASKHTDWHHSWEAENFIRNHPFFRNRPIADLTYYDVDVVGDWGLLAEPEQWSEPKTYSIAEIKVEELPRRYVDKGWIRQSQHPLPEDFQVGKYYSDGDVLNYIYGQHGEFSEEDSERVTGIFQCIEVDPKTIPESEWHIEPSKVDMLSQSARDFPPIVIEKDGTILDGGHRLAAAIQKGIPKIKVLKQVRV